MPTAATNAAAQGTEEFAGNDEALIGICAC